MARTGTERRKLRTNADRLGYFPPFDGMRGLGVIAVLLAHLSYSTFASFAVAVDMFFIVSGFLITTLLLEEEDRSGAIDIPSFFWRRAFRLLPMAWVTIAGTVLGALASGHDDLIERTISDAVAAFFYVYHVVHPVGIEIATSTFPEHRPLIQLWSLSVEEHFYLIAAFMTLFVVRRNLARQLIALFCALWLFIGVARLTGHVGPRFAWYQRPDALMVGTVLAYVNALLPRRLDERASKALRTAGVVAAAVFTVTVLIGTRLVPYRFHRPFSPYDGVSQLTDGWYWGRFGFSICNACLGVLVMTMVRNRDWWFNRVMSIGWLRAIGVRSYCIYLLHVPIAVVLFETFADKDPETGDFVPSLGLALLYLGLLIVFTELGHRLIEQPMVRRGRDFIDRRKAERAKAAATAP